jgi:broad specificity phosphatase PhoE
VSKTNVHLVRHGHVQNPDRVLYGRLPGFFLSDLGRQQAALLGRWFGDRRLGAVLASPLERAQQTAEAIVAPQGLQVRTDARLIEASNVFEGIAGNLIWYLLRRPWALWALRDAGRPSWGERHVDLVERMHQVVDEVRAEHAGLDSVLVSHQAPIWVARCAFERRRLRHDPRRRRCTLASVTTLTFDGDDLVEVTYAEPAAAPLRGRDPGRAGA